MTYSVRLMRKEDITQVNQIDREAFPTQLPPANYKHELQNQLAHYIVVCDDSTTIAEPQAEPDRGVTGLISKFMVWLNRKPSAARKQSPSDRHYIVGFAGIWALADEAHVTNIAVRQQYQHRGLGELLLISIIDLSRGLRAGMMTLEVRASNYVAQNLYLKYRFAQVGVRRGYYLDNKEDGIIMSTESITSAAFQSNLKELRDELARKRGLTAPAPGKSTDTRR